MNMEKPSKQTLRTVLVCVSMLVFPAWAGSADSLNLAVDAKKDVSIETGIPEGATYNYTTDTTTFLGWLLSCDEEDYECKKKYVKNHGKYSTYEVQKREGENIRNNWHHKNRDDKFGYLGIALTAPFVAEEGKVMFGVELVTNMVFRFGEFFASMGGGANASMGFANVELFYRPPIDMNGIWKIAPEIGMGVTSYEPFDSEDRIEPLYHYSVGVRYEHTLQDRKNIIEDEDVLINGVSAGCAVWMNYADFAGVKCDVRFGLYL